MAFINSVNFFVYLMTLIHENIKFRLKLLIDFLFRIFHSLINLFHCILFCLIPFCDSLLSRFFLLMHVSRLLKQHVNFLLNWLDKGVVYLCRLFNLMSLVCIFKDLTVSTESYFTGFAKVIKWSLMQTTLFLGFVHFTCSLEFVCNITHKSESN